MLKLDEKEQKTCQEILNACDVVNDLASCEDEVEYYFEVHPGSIGQTVYLVVPKYNIKQNITNHDSW